MTIERIAYQRAAETLFCNIVEDFYGNGVLAAAYLDACVNSGDEPDALVIWQPFEHCEPDALLEILNTEADGHSAMLKQTLELVKQGLVRQATDCTLPSDMNELDMPGLLPTGD